MGTGRGLAGAGRQCAPPCFGRALSGCRRWSVGRFPWGSGPAGLWERSAARRQHREGSVHGLLCWAGGAAAARAALGWNVFLCG